MHPFELGFANILVEILAAFAVLTLFCSAVLAAGCPELAPFMADECLLSMGDTEGIDYTMKEYMKLVAKTQACVDRLNEEGMEMSQPRNSRKKYDMFSSVTHESETRILCSGLSSQPQIFSPSC